MTALWFFSNRRRFLGFGQTDGATATKLIANCQRAAVHRQVDGVDELGLI